MQIIHKKLLYFPFELCFCKFPRNHFPGPVFIYYICNGEKNSNKCESTNNNDIVHKQKKIMHSQHWKINIYIHPCYLLFFVFFFMKFIRNGMRKFYIFLIKKWNKNFFFDNEKSLLLYKEKIPKTLCRNKWEIKLKKI